MNKFLVICLLGPLLVMAAGFLQPASAQEVNPRDTGLPLPWLIFGFAAQAVFAARFLVQWIASEKARQSVVPLSFWILSMLGGICLFIYFLRRGDPVGMAGQSFGILVYSRNLWLIFNESRQSRLEG